MNEQTYKTQTACALGPWLGMDNQTAQASGYERGVPDRLWATDSFEWQIDYYEDSSKSVPLALTDGGCTLYICLDGTEPTRYTIGTGTVGTTPFNTVTFTVAAGAIPAAMYGNVCLLIAEVCTTGKRRTCVQRVQIDYYRVGTAGETAFTGTTTSTTSTTTTTTTTGA